MTITPDTKDWTWVLDRPCPQCGLVAADVPVTGCRRRCATTPPRSPRRWAGADVRDPAARRPGRSLEYACHVRDVHRALRRAAARSCWPRTSRPSPTGTRTRPRSPAATPAQDPASSPPRSSAGRRPGRRSLRRRHRATPGSAGRPQQRRRVHGRRPAAATTCTTSSTTCTTSPPDRAAEATIAAYDASRRRLPRRRVAFPDRCRGCWPASRGAARRRPGARDRQRSRARRPGARGGRAQVRRTDVSAGVRRAAARGGPRGRRPRPAHRRPADPAQPDEPYDAVWANACLLHVARADLPRVLHRLAASTRPGGVLHVSLKEGDGEGWSTHGNVAAPRHFTYWREQPLREVLDAGGWSVARAEPQRRARAATGGSTSWRPGRPA